MKNSLLISLLLLLLSACSKPKNTDMSVSGRLMNVSNNTPLGKYHFQLNFHTRSRAEPMGYQDFEHTDYLITDSSGYFSDNFKIKKGLTYSFTNSKDSMVYSSTQNGNIGTIYIVP